MLIAVTNRLLCKEDFLARMDKLARAKPDFIILREKDLDGPSYARLAEECALICQAYGVPLSLNTHLQIACALGLSHIHLPMPVLRNHPAGLERFSCVGASVHSAEEARYAEQAGADYVIAGHVYETGCKQGLPGRGTAFLQDVRAAVSLPVLAIGGITAARIPQVLGACADGICLMSELMTCEDPAERIRAYRAVMKSDSPA